jgi:branched-chain amino acid transport system permease protein
MKAFVIGTACAGLSGALYAHYMSYISPESFKLVISIEMVTMVVIGGLGSMLGGIVGSLVVILLPEFLRVLADYRLVVYGSLLIIFMMFLPGGLADLARKPVHLFFTKIKRTVSL